MGKCNVNWCNKNAHAKGYCCSHYHRLVRYGDPLSGGKYKKPIVKLRKIIINGVPAYKHPLYNSWRSMADRCLTETNPHYKDYGGRGIKICSRWRPPLGFKNFVEDMGDKPSYDKGPTGRDIYSLDRIDVNGDYCPENCRWANQSEQMNNTRINRKFTAFGQTGTFTELFRSFAPECLKKKTAERRFYDAGWPIEKAITVLPWGRK